jgi:hypothetical protein
MRPTKPSNVPCSASSEAVRSALEYSGNAFYCVATFLKGVFQTGAYEAPIKGLKLTLERTAQTNAGPIAATVENFEIAAGSTRHHEPGELVALKKCEPISEVVPDFFNDRRQRLALQ